MYHQREKKRIKLIHYDETKERAHDSQIIDAKGNLKLSQGGSSQRSASGTNYGLKLYVRTVMESEA